MTTPHRSWPFCERVAAHEQQGIRSWGPSNETPIPTEPSGELEECFAHAQHNSMGMNTYFDSAMLFSGVPPRWPWVLYKGFCACFTAAYVVLIMVACVGWMIWHCFYVIAKNDNFVTGHSEVQRYGWLYGSSFCFPSVDGMINLIFALMLTHGPRTEISETYKTLARGFSQNWKRDRRVFCNIGIAAGLVLARFVYIFSVGSASQHWILACGSLIEFLPHVAPYLLIHKETVSMCAVLEGLQVGIIDDKIAPARCVAVYKDFYRFVRSVSAGWQTFMVFSVGMEVYIIVFQSLWSFLNHDPSEPHSVATNGVNTSLLVLTEGCFIAFKLWPLVAFNHKVKRFANGLIIAAQSKEDSELCSLQGAEQAARLQKAANTTALLFSSRPPCLTIFSFAVDTKTLISILISVMFTSIGRYIFAVAESLMRHHFETMMMRIIITDCFTRWYDGMIDGKSGMMEGRSCPKVV